MGKRGTGKIVENDGLTVQGKEVDYMPTIEQVEYERVAYVKGMEFYA